MNLRYPRIFISVPIWTVTKHVNSDRARRMIALMIWYLDATLCFAMQQLETKNESQNPAQPEDGGNLLNSTRPLPKFTRHSSPEVCYPIHLPNSGPSARWYIPLPRTQKRTK